MSSGMATYNIAKNHVDYYDKVMREHHEAMDCCDCEAYLQLGIEAFYWLVRADRVIRQAINREVYEYDPQIEKGMRQLFRLWLNPCEPAEQWVNIQQDRGYEVSNLPEFRKCCEEARAIVESFDETDADRIMTEPLISLRDEALHDHRHGETAEFF